MSVTDSTTKLITIDRQLSAKSRYVTSNEHSIIHSFDRHYFKKLCRSVSQKVYVVAQIC